MKNVVKVLVSSFLLYAFVSCTKKTQTFQFGHYPERTMVADPVILLPENFPTASISNENLYLAKPAIVLQKQIRKSVAAEKVVTDKKPTFKQQMVQKLLVRKIQKMEEAQAKGNYLKVGIVIAAVSLLILIVVAAGLLGGLSSLFWLIGGLGLLTGLLLILLDVLDVI
jgi:hypothetical protein